MLFICYTANMDKESILKRVKKLSQLYQAGKIPILSQHVVQPEFDKSSRESYLYFTLAPCLNFQRSSPALWQAALATYQDPETNYLFFPEKVLVQSREQVQTDLLKHKLSLQRNKHTDIWLAISNALHDLYADDPRKLFIETSWDVLKILDRIQVQQRKHFPYLSGPKLSNYWLYILSNHTNAKFTNPHEISIIPDTHVLQCTVQLGITPTISTPLIVARAWKELLQDSGLTPAEMHAVLWNWSRNNFLPEV